MANRRLTELTELIDLKSADLFYIVDSAANSLESKKIRADSIQNFILSGSLVSASYAFNATTASYVSSTNVISSSYSLSSSWSDLGQWSKYSDTASYITSSNITGAVPSSSYSAGTSFLFYTANQNNGSSSYALTSSYVQSSQTASFLSYISGVNNGTCSYAISAANAGVGNVTSSYLIWASSNDYVNGTSSYAYNIRSNFSTNDITSSYLRLVSGRNNGSASYSISSSSSTSASYSATSSFLNYTSGQYNGTSSYSLATIYSDIAGFTYFTTLSTTSSWASSSLSSSYAVSSSRCVGTSSYSISSSHCVGSASYSSVSFLSMDSNQYRLYGPYNSADSGGLNTTTEGYIQNFIIAPPTTVGSTVIITALCDIKIPITTTDTDLATVSLYLDYTESGLVSYGPLDTSRPNNYISSSAISGYARQSIFLSHDWPLISGSWWRLSVRTTGGALINTTRGVTFYVYTKPDTTLTKTAYPPF